jgi:hypothetical protein
MILFNQSDSFKLVRALLAIFFLVSVSQTSSATDLIFKSSFENLYSLTYSAASNGSISGNAIQIIEQGSSGIPVTALADSGYHFLYWSDASTDNPRTDSNIQANVAVTASFSADTYGVGGPKALAPIYQEPTQLATIYYPADASPGNKVPVVFFIPGWGGLDPNQYDTMLRFIASKGYAAIFVEDNHNHDFTSTFMLEDILAMVNDATINPILDTTRIGVYGHSSGGGHAFNVLDKLSDVQGWGENGRFIFITEPWFAFDMMQADMLTLPGNTNIVIQQYGANGNSANNGTDARIVLTEYYLLESIADYRKDYQVHPGGDHNYPYGAGTDYSTKQIILAPLDALMEYSFVNPGNIVAHDAALELGSDDPYANGNGIQEVYPRGDVRIAYPCNGYDFTDQDIDFCDIKGYPYTSQFDQLPIATNNSTIQPPLLGTSTDLEFGTAITRLTERVLQNDTPTVDGNGNRIPRGNHHPYPKTQAWNADMSMLRMNYRLYDANTLQELPITGGTNSLSELYNINGALNERKWSTQDPNVFYGVYVSWDKKGEFWKGTIDRAANSISYTNGLLHSFGNANTYELFSLGKFEGNLSFDDRHVVFAARKIGQNFLTAIVYDLNNDTFIEKEFDGNNGNAFIEWTDPPATQVFDWVSVSPLGNHILISTGGNIEQYDMALNHVRQLATSAGHGDLGIAQNGDEVYVQYEYGADSGVWVYRLNDGFRHQLLPGKYNGGHVSCRNYQRPGWCYLSTKQETHREVFALRINFAHMSKHAVNRFAQTHTLSIDAQGNTINSLGGVSPDGRRVLFFTNWEDSTLDYYDNDTYQAQMPH